MVRYMFGTSELLECIQHAVQNQSITAIDLDMPKGEMKLTFTIPQRLVSRFNKSCEQAVRGE